MNTMKYFIPYKCFAVALLVSAFVLNPGAGQAQRMSHKTPTTRPSTSQARPAPSGGKINGGATKAAPRPAPSTTRPETMPAGASNKAKDVNVNKPQTQDKVNSGNRTNVDNSRVNVNNKNVNINVDNSTNIDVNVNRNTSVRHCNCHYGRPPYYYGGHHYYCHHHYYYHPYRPYYWGPAWHPWGFFVATLTATAVIVTINNLTYHYDQGVFYTPSSGGYTVVTAPVGATVATVPSSAQPVVVNQTVTNNYYYGGTYYEKSGNGYTVVQPTAGSLVENLPEGAEEVRMGEVTYVKYGETYYQPVQVDGKNMYEVVQVE